MKKLLSLFLSLCIMGTMLAGITLPAAAATEYTSGYYTYTVSNGKATITDLKSYTSGSITIPTTLGGHTVTSIGDYAFMYSFYITSVTIPNSVTSIGDYAFHRCNKLARVTMGNGVTSIGKSAFSSCDNLTSVTIANSVTSIGDLAFSGCSSLTSITIPEGVTSIGDSAFSGCSSLISITIPEGVTSIGDSAFLSCDSLANVTIPDSVTSIGDYVFYDCGSLTSINVSENNSNYSSQDGILFNKSKTTIIQYPAKRTGTSYIIPDSVTSIAGGAFCDCKNLVSISIHNKVTRMGEKTFYGCSSLTSITIPNSIKSIGEYAFNNCNSLTSITIPDSVISINNYAFNGCSSLASITIPDSVTSIGVGAFQNCSSLAYVTIPDSVTKIRSSVFCNCTSLTSITLPEGITSIGTDAFYGCTSFTSIIIPDSITSIGARVFNNTAYYNDSSNWEGNVLYIGELLVGAKSSLLGMCEVKKGTKIIAPHVFDSCSGLVSITIPDSVTNIGERAFYNCSSLKTIYYCGTVEKWNEISIGFSNSDLTSATRYCHYYDSDFDMQCNICGAARTVTDYSFLAYTVDNGEVTITGCNESAKDDIILPSKLGGYSVTSIDEMAFFDCDGITSLSIPNSVKTIGDLAFFDCGSIVSISIPNSVTSIGVDAFSDCIGLTSVYYRGSETDKEKVYIDESNTSLTSATWYYNSCLWSSNHKYDNDCDIDCDICDDKRETNHTYEAAVTAPTCKKTGYTTYTCTACGDSYTSDETAALAHTYNNGVVTAPTCTEAGYTTYTCTVCGDRYTANETAAFGHTYNKGVVTIPTCTEAGYTTYTCTVCGDSYIANETAALGHSYDNGVVTDPTDVAQGYTTYTCTVCGYSYKDNYTAILTGVQNMKIEATDTSLIITWDKIEGTTRNILYVKNEAGETIITRSLDADRTSVTLSWPNELEWDKTYTIGIRAKTTTWLDTVWKDAALTVAGRIVDVKTQSVGRTIKVDWRAYEGATQYYVYVYKKGEYPTAFSAIEVNGKNSVSIINAIYAEVDYEVRVIATKGVTKMKTIDAIPVAARLNVYNPDVFIERGITPTSVGIAWDEIRGVDKCWAYLTPVNGGETIIRETTRGIVGVYNLTPNTEYTVQLQARIVDADGIAHYSGMSEVLGTITTSDWENISFTAKKTEGGAQLTWTPPANVYEYIIYRSTNGGQSYKEIATITDSEVSSYVDAKGKDGYIYAIVTKLKDDFVAVKSGLIKAKLS